MKAMKQDSFLASGSVSAPGSYYELCLRLLPLIDCEAYMSFSFGVGWGGVGEGKG